MNILLSTKDFKMFITMFLSTHIKTMLISKVFKTYNQHFLDIICFFIYNYISKLKSYYTY